MSSAPGGSDGGRGRFGTGSGGAGLEAPAVDLEIDGLRPYRQGSPATRIHWPSVARRGEMLELRLVAGADRMPLVALDSSPASRRRGAGRRRARRRLAVPAPGAGERVVLAAARRRRAAARRGRRPRRLAASARSPRPGRALADDAVACDGRPGRRASSGWWRGRRSASPARSRRCAGPLHAGRARRARNRRARSSPLPAARGRRSACDAGGRERGPREARRLRRVLGGLCALRWSDLMADPPGRAHRPRARRGLCRGGVASARERAGWLAVATPPVRRGGDAGGPLARTGRCRRSGGSARSRGVGRARGADRGRRARAGRRRLPLHGRAGVVAAGPARGLAAILVLAAALGFWPHAPDDRPARIAGPAMLLCGYAAGVAIGGAGGLAVAGRGAAGGPGRLAVGAAGRAATGRPRAGRGRPGRGRGGPSGRRARSRRAVGLVRGVDVGPRRGDGRVRLGPPLRAARLAARRDDVARHRERQAPLLADRRARHLRRHPLEPLGLEGTGEELPGDVEGTGAPPAEEWSPRATVTVRGAAQRRPGLARLDAGAAWDRRAARRRGQRGGDGPPGAGRQLLGRRLRARPLGEGAPCRADRLRPEPAPVHRAAPARRQLGSRSRPTRTSTRWR